MKKILSLLTMGLLFGFLDLKAPIDMEKFFDKLHRAKTPAIGKGDDKAPELEKFMRPYFLNDKSFLYPEKSHQHDKRDIGIDTIFQSKSIFEPEPLSFCSHSMPIDEIVKDTSFLQYLKDYEYLSEDINFECIKKNLGNLYNCFNKYFHIESQKDMIHIIKEGDSKKLKLTNYTLTCLKEEYYHHGSRYVYFMFLFSLFSFLDEEASLEFLKKIQKEIRENCFYINDYLNLFAQVDDKEEKLYNIYESPTHHHKDKMDYFWSTLNKDNALNFLKNVPQDHQQKLFYVSKTHCKNRNIVKIFHFLDEEKTNAFLEKMQKDIDHYNHNCLKNANIENIKNLITECTIKVNNLLIEKYNFGFFSFFKIPPFSYLSDLYPNMLEDEILTKSYPTKENQFIVMFSLFNKFTNMPLDAIVIEKKGYLTIKPICRTFCNKHLHLKLKIFYTTWKPNDDNFFLHSLNVMQLYYLQKFQQRTNIKFQNQKLNKDPTYAIMNKIKNDIFFRDIFPFLNPLGMGSIFCHFIFCKNYSFCQFLIDFISFFQESWYLYKCTTLINCISKLLPYEKIYTKEPHTCKGFRISHCNKNNHEHCIEKIREIFIDSSKKIKKMIPRNSLEKAS